jgi:UDP-2,3-diacylglucosamine pyrophosphatase LpxH
MATAAFATDPLPRLAVDHAPADLLSRRSVRGSDEPIPFAPPATVAGPADTLIVSDLHLGLPDSRPRDLLDLLVERPFGRLILLGDVVHDPTFRHLDADAWRLLHHIRGIARQPGRELVWLHGNHDRKLADAIPRLFGIEGRDSYRWRQQGRQCLAMHGDCFDAVVTRHAWFGQLCSDLFAFGQRCLAPHHGWLARLDAWQVRVGGLGQKVAEAAARHAAAIAVDLVVCGHTHEPMRKRLATPGGLVTYANSGTWVGSPASFVTVGPNGLGLDFLP